MCNLLYYDLYESLTLVFAYKLAPSRGRKVLVRTTHGRRRIKKLEQRKSFNMKQQQQQQQQQHEIRFVNKVKNDIDVDRDTFQIFKTMK